MSESTWSAWRVFTQNTGALHLVSNSIELRCVGCGGFGWVLPSVFFGFLRCFLVWGSVVRWSLILSSIEVRLFFLVVYFIHFMKSQSGFWVSRENESGHEKIFFSRENFSFSRENGGVKIQKIVTHEKMSKHPPHGQNSSNPVYVVLNYDQWWARGALFH